MDDITPKNVGELRRYCASLSAGRVPDVSTLERLLTVCWDELAVDDGGMTSTKLVGRMENVIWQPPKIIFRIERHGATVMGSSRAEMQEWTIDLEQQTATVETVGRCQVRPMQSRLDVRPIAEEIAAAIVAGRPDDCERRSPTSMSSRCCVRWTT